ncbi:hypothetical protein CPB97_001050 [Podila verticillata]|nr:hypothetical protein CPB97_001050 [Podila verticillata]
MNTNPLAIPELLYRIGSFVTQWVYSERRYKLEFEPKHIIACINVCRLWRDTLTPLLWAVFDDNNVCLVVAPHLNSEKRLLIPVEILQAHQRHLRYARIQFEWPTDIFQPTHLQELVTDSKLLAARHDLLRSNPYLNRLYLDFGTEATYDKIKDTLEATSQLKTVTFNCLRFANANGGTLSGFFDSNSQLEKLAIFHIHGLERFDLCQPLQNLTRMLLIGTWISNEGLLDIFRHSPNLETLETSTYDCPVMDLSRVLRGHCQKLVSLWCIGQNRLDPDDVLALVQAVSHLVRFKSPCTSLTAEIIQALLAHASSLETVKLRVHGYVEDIVTTMGSILAAANLKALLVRRAPWLYSMEDGIFIQNLFQSHWSCQELEAFKMQGFLRSFTALESSGEDSDDTAIQRTRSENRAFMDDLMGEGWAWKAIKSKDELGTAFTTEAKSLLGVVSEWMQHMPRLCQVQVEDFMFCHKDRLPSHRRRDPWYIDVKDHAQLPIE